MTQRRGQLLSPVEDLRVAQERLDLAQERVDIATAFGEKLRTLRRTKGISQRTLAKKCRLSPETVTNTERVHARGARARRACLEIAAVRAGCRVMSWMSSRPHGHQDMPSLQTRASNACTDRSPQGLDSATRKYRLAETR